MRVLAVLCVLAAAALAAPRTMRIAIGKTRHVFDPHPRSVHPLRGFWITDK